MNSGRCRGEFQIQRLGAITALPQKNSDPSLHELGFWGSVTPVFRTKKQLHSCVERNRVNNVVLSDIEKEHVAELLDSDAAARQQFVELAQWDTELGETIFSQISGGKNTFLLFRSPRPFWPEAIYQLWTGVNLFDMHVGRELTGGTIEGLAPDSWFELQFQDGSIVTISGTSMLTFADVGQKKLRLKQGAFTADVVPQPVGKPMIVQTPSTVIEVVGTRFEVEALQAFTTVSVREGNVRLKHLVDGNSVNIPADYRVIAEAGGDLSPMPLPAAENYWKSQLDVQAGGFGKWHRQQKRNQLLKRLFLSFQLIIQM